MYSQSVMPHRVLITGANGFVGSAIAEHCVRAGMSVSTTGRTDKGSEGLPNYFKADVTKPDELARPMSDVDCVVHAAGLAHQFHNPKNPEPFFKVNVEGTTNVAQSAARAGVRHFVLISSVSVYGPHASDVLDETATCRPQGAYAESKYQAEQRAGEIIGPTGACLTILRFPVMYGEGDRGNIARLIRAVDHKRFVWIGRGINRKSMIHRDDVARACVTVLREPCQGISLYNVADAAYSMNEIVQILTKELRRDVPRWRIPQGAALAAAKIAKLFTGGHTKFGALHDTIKKWLATDVYDAQKFQKQFSFAPQVSLEEGLRREVAWYKQRVR